VLDTMENNTGFIKEDDKKIKKRGTGEAWY
jgi:hypothetical protein